MTQRLLLLSNCKTMNNSKIIVGGVEKFSAVDFPEKLCAVIFMQGCPWKCPFCHNASLRNVLKSNDFDWEKFINFLKTRIGKLDAVVFSGGEPLVQDNLKDAIEEVKTLGFEIGLHTGGYRPEHLAKILPLLDWVGFDIKAPFVSEKYEQIIGVNHLSKVEQSLDLLLDWGGDFECRTTCDPRFLSVENLIEIAQQLKTKGVKKYFLQKYRPIATDTLTTDDMCENLVSNPDMLQIMKNNFDFFDVRR